MLRHVTYSTCYVTVTRGTHSRALLHTVDLTPLILDLADGRLGAGGAEAWSREAAARREEEGGGGRDGGHYFRDVLHGRDQGRGVLLHNIMRGYIPPRLKIHFYSPLPEDYAVVRRGRFKLMRGFMSWCEGPGEAALEEPCPAQFLLNGTSHMLFDLQEDPGETRNCARENVEQVNRLSRIIDNHMRYAVDYLA